MGTIQTAPIIAEMQAQTGQTSQLGMMTLTRRLYEGKRRKGLNKSAFEHLLDVQDLAPIEKIEGIGRKLRLYQACFLHDILEDTDLTPHQLAELLGLKPDVLELICLLSRNIPNPDGTDYLEGIMRNEDAILVKFADRIANLQDLIFWIELEDAFTEQALGIARKYRTETAWMLGRLQADYPALHTDPALEPMDSQRETLQALLAKLEGLITAHKADALGIKT